MNDDKLQSYISSLVQKERAEHLLDSPQLTIGELLDLLKDIPTKDGDDAVKISFDFGSAYPTGLSSWRGSYCELAINYGLGGYDNDNADQFAHRNLKDFVEELQGAVGKTYTGWKGGDFVMGLYTPLWVDNDGNSNNTGVVGIKNDGWRVIILTQYCEY